MPYFSTNTQHSLKCLRRFELLTFDKLCRFYSRQCHSLPSFSKCLLLSLENPHLCVKRIKAPHHTNKCCSFYSTGFGRFWAKDDHYSVLGVKEDASSSEIRAAFLKKSKECHPDVNPTDPNSQEKFVRVNEAYSVLSQSSSKGDYDRSKNSPQTEQPSGPYGHHRNKYRAPRDKPKSDYQPPHNFQSENHYEIETHRATNVAFTVGMISLGVYLVFSNFKQIKNSILPSESAMRVAASSAKPPSAAEHYPKNFRFVNKKQKDKVIKEEEIIPNNWTQRPSDRNTVK